MTTLLRRVGGRLAGLSERWIPDAFVFAVLLTIAVFLLALAATDRGPAALIGDWYLGFWSLLEFGMQMTLVLVTGHALATAAPVRRGLRWLAAWPSSAPAAVALTALAAALFGLVHWGLGLVTGAMLALEVARSAKRRGIRVHLPLLAAAGYLGLMVWHSGLSGSAPLVVNTPGHFLEARIGLVPLEQTILRPFNLLFLGIVLVAAPALLAAMHPAAEDVTEIDGEGQAPASTPPLPSRASDGLGHSRLLVLVIVAGALAYVVPHLLRAGFLAVDLNLLNFCILMLGLALHGTLASYTHAALDGARAAAGVIVQFPFYAGIMGVMVHSGLVQIVADAFAAVATPSTLPVLLMTSAALINLAVPSGGGQWAVQGPIVIEAAGTLGVDHGIAVMAVAMGDQLTNMVQPFWALPLLGITGLRAGQVLGYTGAVMVVAYAAAVGVLIWAR
jgi:short-chain fatty acids transporter